ncbi:MAG TPA: 2-hydroxyacyl-CoA dehydratase [Bacillota bacterium]|jgi:predicted nucleotide-binding protein (sugar kinase/HSP70/actin superfamily)|nr:2-hydroxyacyl-CoA dehydratase [Bacillota bacterium]HOL10327.1 2-hydroxyacyl-CoA dehydratase [Bacillota bacterium]HPO98083.1 2-hydroxyacyl-CoA dehydratase [Bacillota bacterium]
MLKVTFPHIGNSHIPFKTLLSELGVEPVIPPPISARTITLGTKIAPEFACFPLKVNLGNYIEAIEAGAEVILMAGGVGPCRFGYYGEVQREILADAGYNVEFLVFEAPKTHPLELWTKIKHFFPRHRLADFKRAIHLAWLKAEAIDKFDRLVAQIRPQEKVSGTTSAIQAKFYHLLDAVDTKVAIKRLADDFINELQNIPLKDQHLPRLRIVLLGEIYLVLESRVNFQIERLLGEMGVIVERTIYFTDWVRDQLVLSIFKPNWNKASHLLAKPYLQSFVGGHGIETVAHTVAAGVNRYDGVIQLAPFTCMPEIVAMQTLPNITKELNIPVLSIIIDEHSAEAGVKTRLEAFVDLLAHRKNRRVGGRKLEVISGN